MSTAALLLAAALLPGAGPARVRARITPAPASPRARDARGDDDPLALAAAFDVLAVCLRSGMPVAAAARAGAGIAPQPLAALLNSAADLLAVGVEPQRAWAPPGPPAAGLDRHCAALLRLARRSAASGTALADGVAELAEQIRQDTRHAGSAQAERAGVLIAGPLGLCFLPAFVCLGIVPVIAGLAGPVLGSAM